MILDKEIWIEVHSNTLHYFENLGYDIPKSKDKWNRLRVKRGTKILVKLEDLSKKSNIKVNVKCDDCGNRKLISFYTISNSGEYVCHKCAMNKDKTKKILSEKAKGRKHSERRKRERSLKIRGENNPNWNPNLTNDERLLKRMSVGYLNWRKEVFERDKYICQCCNQRGGNLNAHHIENFSSNPDKILDLSNGATLCKECHIKFHKEYGKRNNDIIQLNKFLIENKGDNYE